MIFVVVDLVVGFEGVRVIVGGGGTASMRSRMSISGEAGLVWRGDLRFEWDGEGRLSGLLFSEDDWERLEDMDWRGGRGREVRGLVRRGRVVLAVVVGFDDVAVVLVLGFWSCG